MKIWRWSKHTWNKPHVGEVEVAKTTDKTVTFPGGGRMNRVSSYDRFFDTAEEAYRFELDTAVAVRNNAESALADAHKRIMLAEDALEALGVPIEETNAIVAKR